MKCSSCSKDYDPNEYSRCPYCGHSETESDGSHYLEEEKPKNKRYGLMIIGIISAILLVFAGMLLYLRPMFDEILQSANESSYEEYSSDGSTEGETTDEAVEDVNYDVFSGNKDKYTLDVTQIYATEDEFNSDLDRINNSVVPQMKSYKGKLDSKANVKAAFDLYDEGYFITEKLYWYGQYQVSMDASNDNFQEIADKGDSAIQEFSEASAFILPELALLDTETLKDVLNYEGTTEQEYVRNLESILEIKSHTLSTETEEALAKLTTFNETPKNIWDKISVLDPVYPFYQMEDGTIIDFNDEDQVDDLRYDRDVAPELFRMYTEMERQNENALAETLMSEVNKNLAYADIKKYDDFLDYGLSSDEVPKEMYLNLLKVVDENLPLLHKYQDLENRMYDNNLMPMTQDHYTIDEAREVISDSYKTLGSKYIEDFNFALDNNWFDLIPRDYKEEGAYTSGMKLVHPYIIMTYNGTLQDVSTLTHEYGHMANYKYSSDAIQTSSWTPHSFTSEVPSTFNEAILSDYLRENAKTTDEKLSYLVNELSLINNTFFYQAMLAEFQYTIHKEADSGNMMSASELDKLFGDLYLKYYGPSAEDFLYEGTNGYWSNISHFYSGFYVYKYSTSLALAYDIKENIKSGEVTVDDYLSFLEKGSMEKPEDALQSVKIDLKDDKWIKSFMSYYKSLVSEYEKLLTQKSKE